MHYFHQQASEDNVCLMNGRNTPHVCTCWDGPLGTRLLSDVATHMGPTCDGRVIVYLKATATNVILGLSNYSQLKITRRKSVSLLPLSLSHSSEVLGLFDLYDLCEKWGPTTDAGPLQYNTLKFYQTFRIIYWRCLVLMSNKFMIGDFEF